MSNFYQGQDSNTSGMSGGFYGGGHGQQQQDSSSQQQQQQQQTQQQQPGYGFQGANVQQWQQPSMQQQQQQQPYGYYPQQQQQPTQGQQPVQAFWNQAGGAFAMENSAVAMAGLAGMAATGNLTSDVMIDWAVKGGSAAWKSGGASMIPGMDTAMLMLRPYFSVDNRYVKRKMQKILFPFMSVQWKRSVADQQGGPDMRIQYSLPHSDENAPDLYLPAMCLITYCLLCAFCKGTAGEFNPEVIANTVTMCFVTQLLEVLAIRFGFYVMQAPVDMLDLFSYTGYKYLGLSMNMVFGLALGHFGYGAVGFYIPFLWTASAASFFMLKTMANNIPTMTAAAGPKREVMVLVFAASQALSMWFVSQTKFL